MYGDDEFEPKENQRWSFLRVMEIMSLSSSMIKSEYLKKCLNHLETFRTERGTYKFPDKYMFETLVRPSNPSVACETFISKDILPSLKRNDKKSFMFEVYSTFFMAMLKKRMED
jgi:hypothetical protein